VCASVLNLFSFLQLFEREKVLALNEAKVTSFVKKVLVLHTQISGGTSEIRISIMSIHEAVTPLIFISPPKQAARGTPALSSRSLGPPA
jgi:hypothetical protein